jgi:hypothetical protein
MAVPRIWASTRRRVFRYRRQEFWAEGGLCHVVDKDTGQYSPVSVREFLHRARAFSREADRLRDQKRWADERDELTKMVADMVVCAQQARAQGDPFDPGALRQLGEARRPARILVPGRDALPPARKEGGR